MNSHVLSLTAAPLAALAGSAAALPAQAGPPATGPWPSWRGPHQNGTSLERELPDQVSPDGTAPSWTYKLAGRGTPVIAGGRVYAFGYEGEGAELQEVLVCLDERDGRRIWERRFTDFLSDVIYYRFSIGSPTIDPDTGNVLCMTAAGLVSCFSPDGELRWQHSLMEEHGRLTFPNGRTGSPLVDGDLAIVHCICSGWGSHGPARDRFFAFDKRNGDLVWVSTPGEQPIDNSFSFPVLGYENGHRVLYAGLGCGNLVCVDVHSGEPLWRFKMSTGGVNASLVHYQDSLVAIHDVENVDSSAKGRMVRVRCGVTPDSSGALPKSAEVWRNDLLAFSSSPVAVGNRIYQTTQTGELACVDADTGKVLWQEKLASDQLHASPVWADGKLWVPMNNGSFYVIRPHDDGASVLQHIQLAGNCLGAPAVANGRIYVHTTDRLYCFAGGSGATAEMKPDSVAALPVGPATRLQVVPCDVVVRQGERVHFRVRSLDAFGQLVDESVTGARWPEMPGVTVDESGTMRIAAGAPPTAKELDVGSEGVKGKLRLRIVPALPYAEDFETAHLAPHKTEAGVQFAPPPAHWISAGLKWEIRELDGGKVLAKTIDKPLFQRTMCFIGHPAMSGYTVRADVYSDGNRRSMSSAGVINQRYLITLKGNHQELEVSSNMELLKEHVKFAWKPKVWYRLETRVDVEADGSGWIRAKAWPRDDPEPAEWTIQVRHSHPHVAGSPGLYGFTPQSRFRVYLDNISVTKND